MKNGFLFWFIFQRQNNSWKLKIKNEHQPLFFLFELVFKYIKKTKSLIILCNNIFSISIYLFNWQRHLVLDVDFWGRFESKKSKIPKFDSFNQIRSKYNTTKTNWEDWMIFEIKEISSRQKNCKSSFFFFLNVKLN